jgi:hypothetical protein
MHRLPSASFGLLPVFSLLVLLSGCGGQIGPTISVCAPMSLSGLRLGPTTRDETPCEALVGKWFDGADTNHDGKLSWDEAEAEAKTVFAQLDANGDGAVTTMELEQRRGAAPGAMSAAHGPGAGPGGMPLASGFMMADVDLNFRVTQQEHLARVRKLFGQFDTDKDGALSRAEAIRALAQINKYKSQQQLQQSDDYQVQ